MYALTPEELLKFCSAEHQRWGQWFQKNPQALDLPLDVARAKSVREVVLHILAVELRYSERLLGKEVTEFEKIPINNLDQLFAVGEQAKNNFQSFLSTAGDSDWKEVLTFPTRSFGTLKGSKRKIFVHALLHGMRHWAQLSTFLRQQGLPQDWPHDFLLSPVIE